MTKTALFALTKTIHRYDLEASEKLAINSRCQDYPRNYNRSISPLKLCQYLLRCKFVYFSAVFMHIVNSAKIENLFESYRENKIPYHSDSFHFQYNI